MRDKDPRQIHLQFYTILYFKNGNQSGKSYKNQLVELKVFMKTKIGRSWSLLVQKWNSAKMGYRDTIVEQVSWRLRFCTRFSNSVIHKSSTRKPTRDIVLHKFINYWYHNKRTHFWCAKALKNQYTCLALFTERLQ